MSEETKLARPTTPGELRASGMFKTGVDFCNARQREFAIGPLTIAAELAAEATMPDWIDPELVYALYVQEMTPAKRAELKIEAPTRELTAAEVNRAKRMRAARYAHECLYRVVRFGTVPSEQIVEALGLLLAKDSETLIAKAREVDKLEAEFCKKDEAGLDAGAGPGGGGNQQSGDFEIG